MIPMHKIPMPTQSPHWEEAALDEYDEKAIEAAGGVEAWYWYGVAPYEGAGNLLFRTKDTTWGLHDMGHCSCYGPTESISVVRYGSLDDVLASCSNELREVVAPLVEAVRS